MDAKFTPRNAVRDDMRSMRMISASGDLLEAATIGHSDSHGMPSGDLLAAANILRNHGYSDLAASLEKKHEAECAAIAKATGE